MIPHYQDEHATVYHGDCLDVLLTLAGESIDSVVTDPPYGLEFMGKEWDRPGGRGGASLDARDHNPYCRSNVTFHSGTIAMREFQAWCEQWATDCLRVLKPGGYLVAFGGTRTYHRLACAIEDAGFEIRDSLAWLYGSGFPKSLDVSKAIDTQAAGQMRRRKLAHFIATRGVNAAWLVSQGIADAKSFTDWTREGHIPSDKNWVKIRDALGVTAEEEAEFERSVVSTEYRSQTGMMRGLRGGFAYGDKFDVTAPATDAAQQWQGWGTALKPAFEPIVVARKPLSGTVAANVLQHGTGALNIDGCRIGTSEDTARKPAFVRSDSSAPFGAGVAMGGKGSPLGRWPANVILDEAAATELDQQSGHTTSGKMRAGVQRANRDGWAGPMPATTGTETYGDAGGASRFFPVFKYEPKAPGTERPTVDGVQHPTVKPLALMRWLVRLVTPPHGLILDPFAGTGTTAEAAIHEHMRCIVVEKEADHLPLIVARLRKPMQVGFDFG